MRLQQIGQPWRDDSTNAVPDVARNSLRLEALPALNKALGRDVTPILARSARLVSGEENVELKPTGEEGIMLIKALLGLGRVVSNVNIPNTAGQIPNLPKSAVVETNALFERDHIYPVAAGELPEGILKLIQPHVIN